MRRRTARGCGSAAARLFILGVGGSAGNASHAVNDFRKICGFEAYAPTDNVSELTARTNDDGWATIFAEWLKGSRLNAKDGLLIFSVGGGNLEKNVSPNLVSAIQLAKQGGRGGRRRRRAGRRIYGEGSDGVRDRADGEPGARDAAQRGVSGGDLAFAGVASEAENRRRRNGNPRINSLVIRA